MTMPNRPRAWFRRVAGATLHPAERMSKKSRLTNVLGLTGITDRKSVRAKLHIIPE
jgi:hypothetical protein